MPKPPIRTFEDLECWPPARGCLRPRGQACRELRLFVARQVVPALPKEERYRLGDQLIRAARSTTANIAEGYGRFHFADNAKFISNSRGSCWEVLDHLITGNDENHVTDEHLSHGRNLVAQGVKLLNGYMRYLRRAAEES